MPIANMKTLLSVLPPGAALGSFTVGNMEMAMGAIRAAEETATPVMLQIAEARLAQSPLRLFGPLLVEVATNASVAVGVHLDHGSTGDAIAAAIGMGFTSVMYDGSHLPYADNARTTREMADMARSLRGDAAVEGELGVVGGSEDFKADRTALCTDPDQAAAYCAATGVDALAVAIGNAHGRYRAAPALRFDVLAAVAAATDVPLVLHGGSGIADAEFRRAIETGIKKINIATAIFQSVATKVRERLNAGDVHDYRPLNEAMIAGAYESVRKHILIFNGR